MPEVFAETGCWIALLDSAAQREGQPAPPGKRTQRQVLGLHHSHLGNGADRVPQPRKVEGRAQTCRPRIYRLDTDVKKMADCQDKDPQLIPKFSIDAHAEGLDGLVGPTISKKANDTHLFQPQTTANLTGIRTIDRSESVDARPSGKRSFFRSAPKSRKTRARKKKSGRPAWARRGEQWGLF